MANLEKNFKEAKGQNMREKYIKHSCEVNIFAQGKYKKANIKPAGFWSDVIQVTQYESIDKKRNFILLREIKWSCGGMDGTLAGIKLVDSFIAGLNVAKEIYLEWEGV